jgi:pyruvate dehydrogenase E2 component (dihydrolipoamide acetyltransferase)
MSSDKPHEIVMPQLGLSMDSGIIVRWLKKPGDLVKQGEILLEVETDKSVVEVEAVTNGRLQIEHGPEDGPINVGSLIGYLLAEGESVPVSSNDSQKKSSEETAVSRLQPDLLSQPTRVHDDNRRRPPSTPAARRRAVELGIDWHLTLPGGLRGQVREQDVIAYADKLRVGKPVLPTQSPALSDVDITPVARRMAEAAGLDLRDLAKRHPGKRLDREDIEQAIQNSHSTPISTKSLSSLQPSTIQNPAWATQPAWPLDELQLSLPARHEPIGLLRRVVAEHMGASVHTGAAVTLTTKADATELVRLRNAMKAAGSIQPVPSYNVLLAVLVARALVMHPLLNASLNGEEILYWETVNVGIAVDTERGLVVPVLWDVASKSMGQLSVEAEDLLGRAAAGKAQPDELSGGTFTITNLGSMDVDFFTPIINPPQCAVLGLGRLNKEFMAGENDEPIVRTMLPLSLTFDHRLVDGGPAAHFLKQVKQFVEQPYLWLR